MTGRNPTRVVSAPVNGCRMPQTRLCAAKAKVNSETETAMSFVAGGTTNPMLCRMPIAMVSMMAAPAMIGILDENFALVGTVPMLTCNGLAECRNHF